jgi:hypothetical protein
MQRMTLLLALALAFMVDPAVAAGTIEITGSGTWGPTAKTTIFTAPSASWSFSFEVPDPLPGTINSYGEYTSTVSNAEYMLNGSLVNDAITSLAYYGGGGPDGGIFDINFASNDVLSLFGAQIYNSNLDLIPGDYVATIRDDKGPSTGQGIVILGVAEPSSSISGGLGLITVVGLALGSRRSIAIGRGRRAAAVGTSSSHLFSAPG